MPKAGRSDGWKSFAPAFDQGSCDWRTTTPIVTVRTEGHSHAAGHGATDKKRVLIAACLTGGFMLAEAVGGLLTGSLALLADAGHMLTESVSLVIAWYAFHLAGGRHRGRTYGFDRVKTLAAYTNGLAIFAIGCGSSTRRRIGFTNLRRARRANAGHCGHRSWINVASFFTLHRGDSQSLNMRGALLHVVGDLLGSMAAIVAALVILATGWSRSIRSSRSWSRCCCFAAPGRWCAK